MYTGTKKPRKPKKPKKTKSPIRDLDNLKEYEKKVKQWEKDTADWEKARKAAADLRRKL